MGKKFINIYIKYTAKKPILFFAMIFVGVLIITILALSTKTSIIVSNDGLIDGNSIIVNEEIETHTGFIYVYSDRNERIYSVEISKTIHEKGKTLFVLKNNDEFLYDLFQKEIKIDIPIREITIFERVFLKGGKVNG